MPDALRRTALSAMGALLLPVSMHAAAQRAPLRLTVVNLMPWAGYTPQGQPTGALIDLSAQLAKLSGIAIEPMMVPYGRAPHMLTAGGSDLMFAIEISTQGAPIEYIGMVDIVLFGPAGLRFQNLDDMHGKTVGHLRGAHYSPELDADPRIAKHPVDSYEQGVRMLRAGRIDALMGVSISIEYALQKLGAAAGPVSPRYLLSRQRLALYANPAMNKDTVSALQTACRQLRQQHLIDELLKQAKLG